jgi:pilus assembly protein CpaE
MRIRTDRGQVTVETLGILPGLVLVIVLLWEIVLTGYTFVLAGHAAREGARALAVGATDGEIAEVVEEDLPGGWDDAYEVDVGEGSVKVRLAVPALIPSLGTPWRLSSRAGTVEEGEPLPEEYRK